MIFHIILMLSAIAIVISAPSQSDTKCGYLSCSEIKSDMLNVHIVAHTHDDVGWLKTVDQYYFGSQTRIQQAGVQYILDSVIQALLRDPEKRFIYVETEFFYTWWDRQSSLIQDQVKMLVNEGRLEFIGGAWSMNDEATTHYQSIIDQFTWGLRRLNDTFGECGRPRVGWQIDPFGHSREQASIFARMGYDGMFFCRLDHEDKNERLLMKTPEFVWKSSPNLDGDIDLFSGVLYNNYAPPPGFCFDVLCSDDPINDDERSFDYNVDEKVDLFFKYVQEQSQSYRSNNIVLTMGEDFHFQDANMWFSNLDKLIKYGNARQIQGSKINLFYSTPSCYLKSLHESDITWPTYYEDFFPYSTDPHAFWTGYFTSRPTLKRFERIGNNFLQVCKQLTATAISPAPIMEENLTHLRKEMGIMQHHDAVTGTEKQHVANDYARRLHAAIQSCSSNIKNVLNQLTTGNDEYKFDFENCLNLNISTCEISEKSNNFIVTLYNPLGHSTHEFVRFPVPGQNYKVTDYEGNLISIQFIETPKPVRDLIFRLSDSQYELIFYANYIPPMGYKSFYISKTTSKTLPPEEQEQEEEEEEIIGNDKISISINDDGLLSSIKYENVEYPITQNFYYYESAYGDNREQLNRSSGAYIFRPNSSLILIEDKPQIKVVKGDLIHEVHQYFNEWVSQVIRVFKNEDYVEFEWMVGPIPIDDEIGKEIVTIYGSNIKSNGEFYTDSNGRDMIWRKKNFRTYAATIQEPVAANYYPIISKIAIQDETDRMAILVDRAQGGTSLNDGEIELMVHRQALHDDAFGVGEALNEKAYGRGLIARGKHILVFGKRNNQNPSIEARERFLQTQKMLSPWPFFSDASTISLNDWHSKYKNIRSGLKISLPSNVHLMTFEPWRDNSFLVRLEHIFEKNENENLSKPVTVNLREIFGDNVNFEHAWESNLAANQWLEDVNRLQFKSIDDGKIRINEGLDDDPKEDLFDVTLGPMEIKTFVLHNWREKTSSCSVALQISGLLILSAFLFNQLLFKKLDL